jgi:hypothetical protein
MTRTYLLALTAAAACAATASLAATPAATGAVQYDVSVRMQDGDRPATNPRLVTGAGQAATFEIANESYSLRMTATPDADGHVTLASSLSSWTPRGLTNDAQTVRLEADGEARMLSFPHVDPATGATSRIRLDVRVRPAG